ncbi:hypothetical protein DFH01_00230 [Falsiroseomonas bella]|uniref:Uncharacterized protein n=1 Tax=Falsiroseomonas bella TaxID=2184016 RepID=A0A317FFA2_9PROT|nr:hypothetical protein [Falsiroseomonas bella]PWS37784.1 hypothetical protein DFH01_00230 [Falsiroseomonas bella]
MTTTSAARRPQASTARDWRREHDALHAELVADGVEPRWAPFAAYLGTAQEAARATGGSLYDGFATLTAAGLAWPARSSVPTRFWSRLRPADDFAPGDGNRAAERFRRAEREAERQAPPPPPKWRPRNVAEFVTSAPRAAVEHLATIWREHHGTDVVTPDAIAHEVAAFVAGAGAAEATRQEVAGAIAWHLAGWPDGEGRFFTVTEETPERAPLRLGFVFAPIPERAPPTDPALIPWRDRMAQREAELLDDPAFRPGGVRDDRVMAAQGEAWREAVAAFAASIGAGEREALRRFAVGGLHR